MTTVGSHFFMHSHLREQNAQRILVVFPLDFFLPVFVWRFSINYPSHVRHRLLFHVTTVSPDGPDQMLIDAAYLALLYGSTIRWLWQRLSLYGGSALRSTSKVSFFLPVILH